MLIVWCIAGIAMDEGWMIIDCHIQSDGSALVKRLNLSYVEPLWVWTIYRVIYAMWELATLFLYWYKVRNLPLCRKGKDHAIYDRVQSILHRVLILTYFYLFVSGIIALILVVGDILYTRGVTDIIENKTTDEWYSSIIAMCISYSMFLMQEHNTSEYIAFLRFMKRYKCICCFCCFGSMVRKQYRILTEKVDETKVIDKMKTGTWNTINLSANVDYGGRVTGMELSVATPETPILTEAETEYK